MSDRLTGAITTYAAAGLAGEHAESMNEAGFADLLYEAVAHEKNGGLVVDFMEELHASEQKFMEENCFDHVAIAKVNPNTKTRKVVAIVKVDDIVEADHHFSWGEVAGKGSCGKKVEGDIEWHWTYCKDKDKFKTSMFVPGRYRSDKSTILKAMKAGSLPVGGTKKEVAAVYKTPPTFDEKLRKVIVTLVNLALTDRISVFAALSKAGLR